MGLYITQLLLLVSQYWMIDAIMLFDS